MNRQTFSWTAPLCAFMGLVLATDGSAIAQSKSNPISQLGVDLVTVGGQSFYGFVIENSKDQLTIAVERKWLAAKFPKKSVLFKENEAEFLKPIVATYVQRIDEWIAERDTESSLVDFLKAEKKRIVAENTTPEIDNKRFIQLRFHPKETKRIFVQPARRRKIAAIAFQYNIDHVTSRSATELMAELNSMGIDLKLEHVDLSQSLTASKLSDREWNIRKAMLELIILEQMEFQGQGDQLFKKSDKPDIGSLIGAMLASAQTDSLSQIGRELGIPEFNTPPAAATDHWRKKVTSAAEREGYRSVLVKRLVPGIDPNVVQVEAVFFAKTTDATWEQIIRVTGTAKLSDQDQTDLELVNADPQIQSVLKTLGGLGLGNNSALVQTALRKGAATGAALTSASEKINAVLGQNTLFLDSPFLIK